MIVQKLIFWFDRKIKILFKIQTLGVRVHVENHKGEILLVKHTYLPGWHYPGGRVGRYEDIFKSAVREVKEETGVTVELLELIGVFSNFSFGRNDHVVFLKGTTNSTILKPCAIEIIEARFFNKNHLPDDTHNSVIQRLRGEHGEW